MRDHQFNWLDPWLPVGEAAQGLIEEFYREVSPEHRLFGKTVAAIGRRCDCDDVLFEISQGEGFAVVHLTWKGRPESNPDWPHTRLFTSWEDWAQTCMSRDHRDMTDNLA